MTDEQKLLNLQAVRRYQASAKGRAAIAKYQRVPAVRQRIAKQGRAYSKTPKGKYKEYISNAKVRGIPFDLTFEQFLTFWRKPCHYSGHQIPTIGLDRIDNSRGYVMGNVVPCCAVCNKAKQKMDPITYIAHCAAVVQHFKLSNPAP